MARGDRKEGARKKASTRGKSGSGTAGRKTSGRKSSDRKGSGWLGWVLVAVAMAVVGTVALAVSHRRAARQEAQAVPLERAPVSGAIMRDFESISSAAWEHAGTTGAKTPIFVGGSNVAGGKPVVLYIGAGYCPYCAAARWSVIASLSRFGTFSGLSLDRSSAVDVYPSTPTFSFHGSRYTSPYIELQTVELESNVLELDGRYQPLDTPTPAQDSLIRTYDQPPYVPAQDRGAIPFILVGGRYMWSGSPYSPGLLGHGDQAAIAATLPAGSGAAAQAILANGNEITAAVCAVDGGQPTDVCSEPVIRQAIEALPHKGP